MTLISAPVTEEELEEIARAEDLAYDIFYAKSVPTDDRTLEECIADEYEEGLF